MVIGNLEVYGVIYKITNKINNKVYIGQTSRKNGFKDRYRSKGVGIERVYNRHKILKDNGYDYNIHLFEAIEKYGFENFDVTEIFDVAFSKEELNIKEKLWINYYDSYKKGYNNNLGGEGNGGCEGFKRENNPASKPVVQLSINGDFIKEWKCMTDATDFLDVKVSKICSVCKGVNKTAGGYVWVYSDVYYSEDYKFKFKPHGLTKLEPVIQMDLEGNYINKYNSVLEASKSSSIKKSLIFRCCSGERKSGGGYIWVYEKDYNPNKDYSYTKKTKKERNICL